MDEILQYLDEHWGKARGCAQCEGEARFVCSTCEQTMYCGEQCQTTHWNTQHRFACIAGNDDPPGTQPKRERPEGEEALEQEATKKERLEQPQLQEVGIEDITSDVWTRMSQFLSGQDLKNLKTSKIMEIRLRKAFFQRFRFVYTPEITKLSDKRFDELKKSIIAVRVSNDNQLSVLHKMGFTEIIDVKLSDDLNVPITWFPPKLKYIIFGENFNQDISLPDTVTHITLGYDFKAVLDYEGDSLLYFDQSKLKGSYYHLDEEFENLEVLKLSDNLRGTYLQKNVGSLQAPKLKYLQLGSRFRAPLGNLIDSCPLEYLDLGEDFNQPLEYLPKTLKVLRISDQFNQPLPLFFRDLPIKTLDFSHTSWNHPLDNLPYGLTELSLPIEFNHPLVLPPNLQVLILGNPRVNDVIPKSVQEIQLGGFKMRRLLSGDMQIIGI